MDQSSTHSPISGLYLELSPISGISVICLCKHDSRLAASDGPPESGIPLRHRPRLWMRSVRDRAGERLSGKPGPTAETARRRRGDGSSVSDTETDSHRRLPVPQSADPPPSSAGSCYPDSGRRVTDGLGTETNRYENR